jgi:phosphoribulokinase
VRINRTRLLDARPVMLAIAGDSGAGKTTLAHGLVEAIGPQRCTSISVDDYHRYDRAERRHLSITPLHPQFNYIDIMEQHLQMLAMGAPILKPVYDHRDGVIGRPQYVVPSQFVIVEGLFPLHTPLARACFDISVYLDTPEPLRREWKLRRDTTERGYTADEVRRELTLREPDSAAFIHPQRRHADIVVQFSLAPGSTAPGAPARLADVRPGALSADLLLRPTIQHPPVRALLTDDIRAAMRLEIRRDNDGTPVDALHLDGYARREEIDQLKQAIWAGVADGRAMPAALGRTALGQRSESLAVTQLLLLYHLVQEIYQA